MFVGSNPIKSPFYIHIIHREQSFFVKHDQHFWENSPPPQEVQAEPKPGRLAKGKPLLPFIAASTAAHVTNDGDAPENLRDPLEAKVGRNRGVVFRAGAKSWDPKKMALLCSLQRLSFETFEIPKNDQPLRSIPLSNPWPRFTEFKGDSFGKSRLIKIYQNDYVPTALWCPNKGWTYAGKRRKSVHFGSAQSPISAWRIIGSTSQPGCSREKAPVPGAVDVAFWSQLCTRTKVLLGGSLSAAEGIWVVPTQEINPGVRDMLWLPGYLVIPFHVSTCLFRLLWKHVVSSKQSFSNVVSW